MSYTNTLGKFFEMISICDTIKLNRKNTELLCRFFEKPTPKNIRWDETLRILKKCGAKVDEKKGKTSGSRVLIILRGKVGQLHKPHPGNELKPYVVRAVKELLINSGVVNV